MILTNIFIVPNYIGHLKYFDKLYDKLKKEKINVIYIFKHDREMRQYCTENNRDYEIFEFEKDFLLNFIFWPYNIYRFKKSFENLLKKYNTKLIIQHNDTNSYNNSFVSIAKKQNVSTLVLLWAVTQPQIAFQHQRMVRRTLIKQKKSFLEIIHKNVIKKYIKIFNIPLHIFFKTYSKIIPFFAMGDSDYIGVINKYTKKFLVKDGIKDKKIKVLGSLAYDDAIKAKSIPKEEIIEKYNLNNTDLYIVLFSCPFYRKEFSYKTIEEQLDYTKKLLEFIDKFFHERKKTYSFLIKLHPGEKVEYYHDINKYENVYLFLDADNHEFIKLADFCLTQATSLNQSIIAMGKSFIDLNIISLNLFYVVNGVNICSKSIGIRKSCNSWEDLLSSLVELYEKKFKPLDNIYKNRAILDGKCYERSIDFIKYLIRLTDFKKKQKIV